MILQPDEPEIILARHAFDAAQASITGVAEAPYGSRTYSCSWYGTSVDPERGSFAVVKESSDLYGVQTDPASGIVGEFIEVEHNGRTVRAYVIGSDANLDSEIALTRRAYLALEMLPIRPIGVYVSVVQ